jgi:hypothetical protein
MTTTPNDYSYESFEKIGDLLFFEAPYVSLMRHLPTDALFCFYWATVGVDYHRWMVFRVDESLVERLIEQQLSYRDFILNDLDNVLLLMDIAVESGEPKYKIHRVLPKRETDKRYLPASTAFFDEADTDDLDSILSFIRKRSLNKGRMAV